VGAGSTGNRIAATRSNWRGWLSAISADISNLSATAERKNGALGAPGFPNSDHSDNNLILIDSQLQQNENYGGIQNARVNMDACVHNMQSAER